MSPDIASNISQLLFLDLCINYSISVNFMNCIILEYKTYVYKGMTFKGLYVSVLVISLANKLKN